jgi:thermitase
MPPKNVEPDDPARHDSGCTDDECCVSPCDPKWLSDEQCLIQYDTRLFRTPLDGDRSKPSNRIEGNRPFVEFRITYEHRLCRIGKQHGPLIFTVTLLPGEKVNLYHSDRYRRITSEQDRYSVQTTFMQFTSVLHQARVTNTLNVLSDVLSSVKTSASGSVGGGLGSLIGLPSGSASGSVSVTDHTQVNVGFVSDQYNQSVSQASLLTHAERSVVVSTYEDRETADITVRSIQNDNACRAVTYFVRQIVELYSVSTVVYDVSYRIIAPDFPVDWHSVDDLDWLPEPAVKQIKIALEQLPRPGETSQRPRPVSIPTDGTVYDPELAHCCSCEPERAEAIEIGAQKSRLETRLVELEVERRRLLLDKGDLSPFEPAPVIPAPPPGP